MKKTLLVLALATAATTAFPQGQVQIINFASGANAFQAPVFGPEPGNPTLSLRGNPATGAIPAGTTVYTGSRLSGTGFTSELWVGALGSSEAQLVSGGATAGFRTGTGAGFNLGGTAVVPGVAAGSTATVQLRAWDNVGGTITSWAMVLANDNVARGVSDLVTSPALTVAPSTPLPVNALRSFNLFVPVPEPSVIALGALGLGALLFRRIRK